MKIRKSIKANDSPYENRSRIKRIQDDINNVLAKFMKNLGFSLGEIADYTVVEITKHDNKLRVEVRAELDYDDLEALCNELDKVIVKYDRYAYFEPVTSGIAEAYINLSSKSRNKGVMSSEQVAFVYAYCDNCGAKNRVKVRFKDWKSPFYDTEFVCEDCGTKNLLTDPHEYDSDGYVIR